LRVLCFLTRSRMPARCTLCCWGWCCADKASFIDMMLNEKTGLTKLYQMLDKKVKFKGKGNEAADLRLLMSMYRQWCHNLCPVRTVWAWLCAVLAPG
jgi:hypothetical protein